MTALTSQVRNVVVLSDTAFIDGGAAAVGLRSAIALARSGRNVTIVSAVGPPMQALLDEPNVRVICTDQAHLAASPVSAVAQGLWNARAGTLLEGVLTKLSAAETIVHVHGWTKALSTSVIHTATRLGFEVVVTLHDFFSICPNGSLYLHNDKKICHIEPMSVRCIATDCDSRNYGVKSYRVVRQLVQKYLGGLPDAVSAFIAVSDFSRAIIQPYLPATARIINVRNPVNLSAHTKRSDERGSHFLYLGRLSPEKGPTLFAQAALEAQVEAIFAGDGACAEEISKINPAAKLLGWLSAERVSEELRAARALVLPSLWYETYGLSVMEAAAAGVAAIVPDTSAARSLVVHGETGLWFEGGSAGSLADALRALGEGTTAQRMGEAAYERFWKDPPTMERHLDDLLNAYETVLKQPKR